MILCIENVPNILDIAILRRIMESLGTKFEEIDANTLKVDTSQVNSYMATSDDVHRLRGSYYLMVPCLDVLKKPLSPFPEDATLG
jgi:UDP-N-acetylglucosamine 1-carboxyvinyltransferase